MRLICIVSEPRYSIEGICGKRGAELLTSLVKHTRIKGLGRSLWEVVINQLKYYIMICMTWITSYTLYHGTYLHMF